MGGIRVFFLCRDFTLTRKLVGSKTNHTHHGNGSYLNKGDSILKTQDRNNPPVLIFEEGNAVPIDGAPKSVVKIVNDTDKSQSRSTPHPLESIKWETWYHPMLRGLNRQRHKRGDMGLGRIFNLKTLPFWLIGFALLINYLGPILNPAAPVGPTPPPMP